MQNLFKQLLYRRSLNRQLADGQRSFGLEAGFSFIELLVTMVIFSVLVLLGGSNFLSLQRRAADAAALSDYRNFKTVATSEQAFSSQELQYQIYNQVGPGNLPSPLERAVLSKGVILHYAVKITQQFNPSAAWDVHTFQFSHDAGEHYYRYVKINKTENEYIIDK